MLRVAVLRNIGSTNGPRAFVIWAFCILINRNRSDFPMPRTSTDYVLPHRASCVISITYAQSHSTQVSERFYLTLPLALPALLAIFFRFFCHSGLVNARTHRLTRRANRRTFPVSPHISMRVRRHSPFNCNVIECGTKPSF